MRFTKQFKGLDTVGGSPFGARPNKVHLARQEFHRQEPHSPLAASLKGSATSSPLLRERELVARIQN